MPTSTAEATLTATEFGWIAAFLFERTGIELRPGKETMMAGRLDRRLRHHGLATYAQYIRLLASGDPHETQLAVDLLTTNETYFFREPSHFEFLTDLVSDGTLTRSPIRVWSAASSSGEEGYSIALTLAGSLAGQRWEVVGTDISSRVVATASRGLYPVEAASKIPTSLLQRFCLKGRDEFEGYLTIEPAVRRRVRFVEANLMQPLPQLGTFDVIFLRNVMIYFGTDTKRELVQRVKEMLNPGGHLLISHSETLKDLDPGLDMVRPSIYRKAG